MRHGEDIKVFRATLNHIVFFRKYIGKHANANHFFFELL
jgi:hypothetical protein